MGFIICGKYRYQNRIGCDGAILIYTGYADSKLRLGYHLVRHKTSVIAEIKRVAIHQNDRNGYIGMRVSENNGFYMIFPAIIKAKLCFNIVFRARNRAIAAYIHHLPGNIYCQHKTNPPYCCKGRIVFFAQTFTDKKATRLYRMAFFTIVTSVYLFGCFLWNLPLFHRCYPWF